VISNQEIVFIYSLCSPSPLSPPTPTKSVDSSILCAFCQKNFFFAIKLHKKKIIVVGEIDSFTCLNEDYLLGVARVSTVAAQKSIEYPTMKFSLFLNPYARKKGTHVNHDMISRSLELKAKSSLC